MSTLQLFHTILKAKAKTLKLTTTIIVSFLLTIGSLLVVLPPLIASAAGEIEIDTCEELQEIDDYDASYILTDDIDCSGTATWNEDSENPGTYFGFVPIGENDDFTGQLDGDGHTVSNLYMNRPGDFEVGLIAELDGGGIVRDIGLESVDITGESQMGALVGENNGGQIINSYATGQITAVLNEESFNIGGLVGELDGDEDETAIIDSYADVEVVGENSYSVGGLVGEVYWRNKVLNSHALGDVTGLEYVGGLVGSSEGNIKGSYAEGQVVANQYKAGGLVGELDDGTIINSHALGGVYAGSQDAGGLVGYNSGGAIVNTYAEGGAETGEDFAGGLVARNSNGIIIYSYATGDVTAADDRAGGLTGGNGGLIENSYASGTVVGDANIGGLSGRNGGDIVNAYSSGLVTGNTDVGGMIGYDDGGETYNSFWDTETSSQVASNGGEGKSTAELQTETTFTDAGWNFENIWDIGEGYPVLLQISLFEEGQGSAEDPYEVSDCYELQNIRLLTDDEFELVNDIDCSAAATWNNKNETNWYIGEGNGEITTYEIGIQNINDEADFTLYINGGEQDPSDYSVDFENGVVTFDTAPEAGGIEVDFSYYEGFQPIGRYGEFDGKLFGNSHTISNLYINMDDYYVGLFEENYGLIRDITLSDTEIYGYYRVGTLVGENDGTINNAHSSGNVSANDDGAGGLVGANLDGGKIISSTSSAAVSGDSRVGGLVGPNGGAILASSATGNVSGIDNVGGLAGRNGGSIKNSHASGYVNGESDLGGLVGYMEGSVSKSYATGNVTMTNEEEYRAGGLVGFNNGGTISKSYSTGSVEGVNSIGGLVGENEGSIIDTYSRGAVTGTEDVGGLVGQNDEATVTNSYSTGNVSGEFSAGGLIGINADGTVEGSFWDTQTSSMDDSDGGEAKATAQMKTLATFTAAEWNFELVWSIASGTNNGYPHFDFRTAEFAILVVDGEGSREYFDRLGYDYEEIDTEDFASESAEYFADYDIVIFEPNSNYDDLRSGLDALGEAMESNRIIVSIGAGGNSGSQSDVDFLGTDYNDNNHHSEEVIVDSTNKFITGVEIGGVELSEENFFDWSSTDHGWLYNTPDEQEGYNVVLENEDGPSMIEYTYGEGHVIVDTLTAKDGDWGEGNDDAADNFLRYLVYLSENSADEDSDGDGLSDSVEDAGPNGGDANNDGIQDSLQSYVTSYINSVTGKYAVLEVDEVCDILAVSSEAEYTNESKDSGFDYPVGLMNFTIDCGEAGYTAAIKQYYFGVSSIKDMVVRKFNPETNAYFDLTGEYGATVESSKIGGQKVAIAAYQVTDGEALDIDGEADGVIVDPVGLASQVVGVPNTGLQPQWQ